MAESLINSIARLRVLEKKLMTKELVSRLINAPTYDECIRALRESGFGQSAQGTDGDMMEALITAELTDTYSLISELMPKRFAPVTDIFRMRHDLTNIKLLYKSRMMGEEPSVSSLDLGGVFDSEKLIFSVKKGDYSMLPKKLSDALESLDVLTYKNRDARLVSFTLDRAFIEYALTVKSGFVREYFSALADFTNLISVIRGVKAEELLPAGAYSKEELITISALLYDSPERIPDLLRTPFDTADVKQAVRTGFEEYLKTKRISALEKARDEYLITLAMRGRTDIDSPAPIIGFLLAKEREAEVVRLILTVKRSGIPMSAVDERSVRLYG